MTALWEDAEAIKLDKASFVDVDRSLYDDLSRLNNELANAHRELARKTSELQKALESKTIGESRFRFLFESNLIGIVIADTEKILDANDAFLTTVGYSRTDLLAGRLRWHEMTPREYDYLDEIGVRQLLETGRCEPFRKEYIRKDGSRVPVLIGAATLRRDPPQWACFVIDISEQRRREAAIRISEKLAAAARLGSSLAHEINNPLAILTNTLYLLRMQHDSSSDSRMLLQNADEALTRVSSITKQLLSLYKEGASPEVVRPDQAIDSAIASLAQLVEERQANVVRTFETTAELTANETELQTVFTNVLRNALERLPIGGRIAIRLSSSRDWRTASDGVRILIADNGPGITADVRRNLFEPFVSTKLERGAGLGLWTVRAITEKYGGSVRVRTSVVSGRSGTSVCVFFPLTIRRKGLTSALTAGENAPVQLTKASRT
jgi:PAS domain S-box-containing protein